MASDLELIRIVDAATAEAARRSGAWLVCRPGCTQCCMGPFPITQLDAARLRCGLSELEAREPARAAQVRERAREYTTRLGPLFPGDRQTGVLDDDEAAEERFTAAAEDDPCPALDPETGTCDLYADRPITCRVFGPPVRSEDGSLGVCELCFEGASDDEIARCEVETDPEDMEAALLDELASDGVHGRTIVGFALVRDIRPT